MVGGGNIQRSTFNFKGNYRGRWTKDRRMRGAGENEDEGILQSGHSFRVFRAIRGFKSEDRSQTAGHPTR